MLQGASRVDAGKPDRDGPTTHHETIARQLGDGQHTQHRHIASLLTELVAHTRFQAGVQAALRAECRGSGAGF